MPPQTRYCRPRRGCALLLAPALWAGFAFCGPQQASPRAERGCARRAAGPAIPVPGWSGDEPHHPLLDTDSATALMKAAFDGDVETVRRELEGGAKLDAQDGYGWTAVRYAVRNNKLEAASALIEAGADIDLPSNSGRTPLMSVAANGLTDMCKLLMDSGVDATAKDADGRSAYDIAILQCPSGINGIADLVSGGQTRGTAQYTNPIPNVDQ